MGPNKIKSLSVAQLRHSAAETTGGGVHEVGALLNPGTSAHPPHPPLQVLGTRAAQGTCEHRWMAKPNSPARASSAMSNASSTARVPAMTLTVVGPQRLVSRIARNGGRRDLQTTCTHGSVSTQGSSSKERRSMPQNDSYASEHSICFAQTRVCFLIRIKKSWCVQ